MPYRDSILTWLLKVKVEHVLSYNNGNLNIDHLSNDCVLYQGLHYDFQEEGNWFSKEGKTF